MFKENRLIWHQATKLNLIVEESDGSPSVEQVNKIIFPSAAVTDNGDGSVTIDTTPVNIDPGTAVGQMLFWNGSKWDNTETGEMFWDGTNNRLGIGTSSPIAKLDAVGSKTNYTRTIASASGTIAITDCHIVVDYTATGTVTLTLPSCTTAWNASASTGIEFIISDKDCNASANNITINRDGSDTIIDSAAGQTSSVLDSDGGTVRIQAISSTEWKVY